MCVGPAGPKPWDLVPQISCPILVAWGDTDPFTPLDGPVGTYFLKQAIDRPNTEVRLYSRTPVHARYMCTLDAFHVFGTPAAHKCSSSAAVKAVQYMACSVDLDTSIEQHAVQATWSASTRILMCATVTCPHTCPVRPLSVHCPCSVCVAVCVAGGCWPLSSGR